MTIQNRFNLVDEPWIPVVGKGLASLKDVFLDKSISALGGNPVQKIALMKLLLAIVQTAYTPKDDEDWKQLGADGMAGKALNYLNEKKDLFWLYGEKPFLQMPILLELIEEKKKKAMFEIKEEKKIKKILEDFEPKDFGNGDFTDLPAENNTILFHRDSKKDMEDSEKGLFILSLMSLALAGKHVDNSLLLDKDYQGKGSVAKVGPSLGRACYLHTYVLGNTICETLFLNLFSLDKICNFRFFEEKVGVPPWEAMPQTEHCNIATRLKKSYMGTLIPMSRFLLMQDNGIYITEGIQYPNHKEGWQELSMAINSSGKEKKVLQANLNKKPWRELVALLSFIIGQDKFDCQQLRCGIDNAKEISIKGIRIWSGGIQIKGDAFGQKISQSDDFVESEIQLKKSFFEKDWFSLLQQEMNELEKTAQEVKRSVYKASKRDVKESKEKDKRADAISKEAETLFWQLCERKFQDLVNACDDEPTGEKAKNIRRIFAGFAHKAYNTYCPKDTARQLDAWAKHRPNLAKYIGKKEG